MFPNMAVLNTDFLIHMQENFLRMKDLFRKKKVITKSQIEINLENGISLSDNMISKINQKLENDNKSENEYFRLLGMKATLLYEQSKQYVCIGHQDKAEEILQKTYTQFKGDILRPELGYVILRILNHLSFYLHVNDSTKAQQYLEESEVHYYQMLQTNTTFSWCTSNELFSPLIEFSFQFSTKEKFEKLFINNMQLLSCIYFKQNNIDKYVLYQHDVLSKMLTIINTDPSQWASKVSRLAMILLQLEMFKEARHHLSAATCIIEAQSVNLGSYIPSPALILKETEVQRTYADISRCWGKYGIKLLTASKYHLFKQKYGEPNDFLNSLWTTPKEIVEIVKISQEGLRTEIKNTETLSTLEDIIESNVEYIDNNEIDKELQTEILKSNEDISSNIEINNETNEEVFLDQYEGIDKSIIESIEAMKESIDNLNAVRSTDVEHKLNDFDVECQPHVEDSVEDITLTQINDGNIDIPQTENIDTTETFTLPEKNLVFSMIETSVFENKVTADFITVAPQAHDLFLFSHFWMKKSKDFYSFHIHPEEYINAVLDLSELYRLIAFFDDDIEVQYKVQKRRSDTLEALHLLIKELNPDVYMNVSIDLLRELAEVQTEMIRLNIHRMDTMGQDIDGMFQKMGAMTDIHSRLNCYRESLGHSVLFGSIRDTNRSFMDKLP